MRFGNCVRAWLVKGGATGPTPRFLLCLALLLAAVTVQAEAPRVQSGTVAGSATLSIEFGRIGLGNADLPGLIPPGSEWLMGEDWPVELTTDTDLRSGEVVIPAGSYSVYARHNDDDTWELIFNSGTGHRVAERDREQDLPGVPATYTAYGTTEELMLIQLSPDSDTDGNALVEIDVRCGFDGLSTVLSIEPTEEGQ